jgi:hypothetical protein
MAGIIQEQHPDRCRLFMQWKQMDWPIMVDSLNLLEVTAVPITLLIDEQGVIRYSNPRAEDLKTFIETTYAHPSGDIASITKEPNISELKPLDLTTAPIANLKTYADALFLWGSIVQLTEAIEVYQHIKSRFPHDAVNSFRLGVALRKRYEQDSGLETDFSDAISEWGQALDQDPNQYIWRRRIQQYGPRLDKPYSFYDWVTQARTDIKTRGETPLPLSVEPGGAEFARPDKNFSTDEKTQEEPDPLGRILRDTGKFVTVQQTLVPSTQKGDRVIRAHLIFTPNEETKAHWNNEVDNLSVWLNKPIGWEAQKQFYSFPNPPEAIDNQSRRIEFEIRQIPGSQLDESQKDLTGYALYFVCEDVDGTCLYRRQDFSVSLSGFN